MLVDVATAAPRIDIAYARHSLAQAAERFAALIASAPDREAPVPGSDWNVGDVAAHVALVGEFYSRYTQGTTEPFVDVSDYAGGSLARTSNARLEAEPERDPAALASRVRDGALSLLNATEGRQSEEVVLWNGQQVDLGALLGIAVGEYLIHGLDLARALSRKWSIGADDARLVLASTTPLLHLMVDPEATKGVNAAYDLRVRGGTRVTVRISHGTLTVEGAGGDVDCHVSADPVTFLLVAYARRSQWLPAATGKLVAWGRKPWLGLRLTHYLFTP